ncbi:MAG: zinc metallopeptidase, partial [Clostridia bacterium]|nr:zinc metallopeptidase [Clostridia bacterium]
MYFYYDTTYILVIFAFLLTLFASFGVNSTFSKYSKNLNSRGLTAADAAR